ncbi:MAG TPA: PQQ-dependent sugar dehydrogenase [Mycobacteriales bacterium]|nr:PQQ-dependent sugar dehydrogenase [Mycobacteriales bacterium]
MRNLGRGGVVLASLAALLVAGAPTYAIDPRTVRIGLTRVASGLRSPVAIAASPDGTGRIFIAEQGGRVRLITSSGLAATPYVDITSRVSSGGERGLLGIAFHPAFKTNGYFFLSYTDAEGDLRVSRFGANPARNAANPATEIGFLEIPHREASNHNGGQIAFAKDGFLYVSTGDGGGGGDPNGNAQNLGSPLGKILRVDINRASSTKRYSIPSTNPFATRSGARPEIWHYGLRNPWRFSFDRQYDNIAIADVGQGAREEANYTPRGQGGINFGWDCREGTNDTTVQYGGSYCSGRSFTEPVWQYFTGSSGRCAVIGGYVYRGARYSSVMNGVYLYGDYCTGEIWGLAKNNGGWSSALLLDHSGNITSFGEDSSGELLMADAGGIVYRIAAARR